MADDKFVDDRGGILGKVERRREEGAVEPQEHRSKEVVLQDLDLPQVLEVPACGVEQREGEGTGGRGANLVV